MESQSLLSKANDYYKKANYKEAISNYELLVNKEPILYEKIGSCWYHLREYSKALSAYTNSNYLSLNKKDERSIRKMIQCYIKIDDYTSLKYCYDKYIKNLQINDNIKNFALALIEWKYNNNIEQAITLLEHNDTLSESKAVLESLNQQIEKLRKDIKENENKINNSPEDIQSLINLSSYYLAIGFKEDIVKAKQCLLKCMGLANGYQDVYYYMGKAYLKENKFDEALQMFEEAKKMKGNKRVKSSFEQSKIYVRKGQYTKALDAFKGLKEEKKNNKRIYVEKGKVYMLLNDYQKALKNFNKVMLISGNNVYDVNELKEECIKRITEIKQIVHPNMECKGDQQSQMVSELNSNSIRIYYEDEYVNINGEIKPEWKQVGNYYFNDNNKDYVIRKINIEESPIYDEIIKRLSTFNCENIVKYKEKRNNLLIIERCKEGNLFDYLHNNYKIIALDIKLKIIKQINKALKYLHDRLFEYIKINPFNILITEYKEKVPFIKLGDFQSIIKNTLFYKRNNNWILESNYTNTMYSYGVLIYEILTREIPFKGVESITDEALIKDFLTKHTLNFPTAKKIPKKLFDILMILLNKENTGLIDKSFIFNSIDTLDNQIEIVPYNEKSYTEFISFNNLFSYRMNKLPIESKKEIELLFRSLSSVSISYSSNLLKYLGYYIGGDDPSQWCLYSQHVDCTLGEYFNSVGKEMEAVKHILLQILVGLKELQEINYQIGTLSIYNIYVVNKEESIINLQIKIANYGPSQEFVDLFFPCKDNTKIYTSIIKKFGDFMIKIMLNEEDYKRFFDTINDLDTFFEDESIFTPQEADIIKNIFDGNYTSFDELYKLLFLEWN